MKLGASPAHVYDKQIVGCESLTAPPKGGGDYGTDFWDMKNFTDAMFCGGVNLMYFHVYVHQPQDQHLPGFSLGPYGQHFERTNTWWELMPGFTSYISRSQSLLQQGRFKADILFSCGENSPNKSLTPAGKHAVPIGYDYDVCDPKVIFERLKVVDGDLVLPNGARYEVLVLPDHRSMTLAMAKRIQELTSKGAKIIGAPPLQQPTLTTRSQEQEFHQVIDSTWQAENGVKDQSLAETLKLLGVPPDFQFTGGATLHTHREFPQGDLYFVANSTELFTKGQGVFRVKEGVPKLFDPVTGEIRSLTKYLQKDGVTSLDLEFEGKQSFFVYFDQSKAVSTNNNADFPKSNPLLTLEGPWNVLFHLVGEAPKKVVFDPLADWTLNKDDTIKYFSGKATYSKSFHLDDVRSGTSYEIDLGSFKNIAEVRLNGKELGVVWCAPWKIGIPRESLKKGNNSLEIDIVNLWPNRMIGDEQLPEDSDWSTGAWTTLTKFPDWFEKGLARTSGRKSFSSFKHWRKESPLFPSGLLGPVRVMIRDATLR